MLSKLSRTALAAGWLLLASNFALASHDQPREEPHVRGVLRVERSRNRVFIGDASYIVRPGTRYVIDEQEVSLRDLADYARQHPGILAEAELSGIASGLILGLEVEDQVELASEIEEVHGDLTMVDSDAGTLTVLPRGGGTPLTFQVDADTDLQYDYTELTLEQLAGGFPVGGTIPIRVFTVAGSSVAEEVELELGVVVSTALVRRYDPVTQTLSVRIGEGNHSPVRFQLLPGTRIGWNSQIYHPRKLRRGQRVTLVSFSSGDQNLLLSANLWTRAGANASAASVVQVP